MSSPEWQKSTFSTGNPDSNCLELALLPAREGVLLRESEDPATILTTTPTRLGALLRYVRAPGATS